MQNLVMFLFFILLYYIYINIILNNFIINILYLFIILKYNWNFEMGMDELQN